ncbi:hypothetical protein H6G97_29390 [Nostoc flagelliforme FACHB-838]|uniref:Uncharacterized protein n=1 Tax=Nostoc flagelliforme FACHB-838 TaxID=2692904 RepID=A0ABR8DVL0_9NOSO|nr:hypothetical protein [Nostoc flagelliforme]MBD2533454.1 hypothetical protein [Nostoc flagelliforme FACHB-838]
MTTDSSKPLIDFSDAKEPPRSLNLEHEAAPIEPEEVSRDVQPDPVPGDFNSQEGNTKDIANSSIINANISAG